MQKFQFQELTLKDAFVINPFFSSDERGGFIKDYNRDVYLEHGIVFDLKETFCTISKRGVIRAIHFQLEKQQPKLIRCIKGHIYDVIVDLRPSSPTFKQWLGFDLTESNMISLLVPAYFGHGYLVIEDSIVSYKCAEVFFPKGDSGIMYNDPTLDIKWPFEEIGGNKNIIVSEKDKRLMSFSDYLRLFEK